MMAQPAKVEAPKYYSDDDARTVQRAQEIMMNPKRKKAMLEEMMKQRKALDGAIMHAQAVKEMKGELDKVFKEK